MIKHLIRQEKTGGYWLIRDEGRAVKLDALHYEAMAKLYALGQQKDMGQWRVFLADLTRDEHSELLSLLSAHGLDDLSAWQTVRHVTSGIPIQQMPDDAVAAPKRIYFEITRGCNLACHSCFNNSHFKLPNELTLDEILAVNRQAYELGVFEIRYTGGECTTVPGFVDIIADARRKGFYISIGTNGVYTDEQLAWLPDSGIDWFIISLDGDREANDKVRGAGTFDRVLHTLSVLAGHPSTRVRLNMVVARHNLAAIEAVAQVAADYGVTSLNLIPLRPYGRSLKSMTCDMFTQSDFYGFIQEINRLRPLYPTITFSTTIDLLDPKATTSHDRIVRKERTCAAGVEACVVGPQGHVYGCSYSPASFPDTADEAGIRTFIAGNIREDSLADIWRDSSRWTVFRDLDQFKNPKCQTCRHYTVRCSGFCQIMAWYQRQHESGDGDKALADFCDPYCFVDLLDAEAGAGFLTAPVNGHDEAVSHV